MWYRVRAVAYPIEGRFGPESATWYALDAEERSETRALLRRADADSARARSGGNSPGTVLEKILGKSLNVLEMSLFRLKVVPKRP